MKTLQNLFIGLFLTLSATAQANKDSIGQSEFITYKKDGMSIPFKVITIDTYSNGKAALRGYDLFQADAEMTSVILTEEETQSIRASMLATMIQQDFDMAVRMEKEFLLTSQQLHFHFPKTKSGVKRWLHATLLKKPRHVSFEADNKNLSGIITDEGNTYNDHRWVVVTLDKSVEKMAGKKSMTILDNSPIYKTIKRTQKFDYLADQNDNGDSKIVTVNKINKLND
jgi:hypothetical protein